MKTTETNAWKKLLRHVDELKNTKIKDLVENEKRFKALSLQFGQLFVDFSKQKITQETVKILLELAQEVEIKKAVTDLMSGAEVNPTEKRPALHSALRLPATEKFSLNGDDLIADVQSAFMAMSKVIDDLTLGNWRGFNGKPISDVVNLGVGGSDLGPMLVCDALDEYKVEHDNPIEVHFASTMDGSQLSDLFEKLNPETTAFVIVSKSFSTIDTLSNAASAKAWLLEAFDDEHIINKQHFIGISTKPKKMSEWGISKEHQLQLWDWVGGRFSLWSTVGLTIALKIGMRGFREMLAGAHALDVHFKSADLEKNIPVLLGLIGVWNANFLNIKAQAILPYDARLKYFPAYLTQLEMESNGKSVSIDGEPLDYDTCPVLWGEVGPNAQHAFYQLLHQGTRKVSSDFLAPIKRFSEKTTKTEESLHDQHMLTLANCFAQSSALMLGGSTANPVGDVSDPPSPDGSSSESNQTLSPHKHYPGDQPSTTILIPELTAYSLGQLIALYEHKVFVMATIWRINPFDQWGVELGKVMAKETLNELLSNEDTSSFDYSTNHLMNYVKQFSNDNKNKEKGR